MTALANTSRGTSWGKKELRAAQPKGPSRRRDQQDQVNERNGQIIEMKIGVALENCRDGIEKVVTRLKNSPAGHREVIPGNESQRPRL